MKIFVVGGFVRDTLMGRHPKDMDFVVVGATPQDMIDRGFQQVGADFPVFLDNQGREWALARKERKVGDGYHGFECEFDETVTLEEDLFRRDLTINAMAMPVNEVFDDGQIIIDTTTVIDPFGGLVDLQNGTLRHVSDHFAEDPVRVLRIARFSARFGFDVSEKTFDLIEKMAQDGSLGHLVAERVWAELTKTIMEPFVQRFFHVLNATAALDTIFPEMSDIPNFWKVRVGMDETERFAILALLMGNNNANNMFQRLRAPTDLIKFVDKFTKMAQWWTTNSTSSPENKLHFFKTFDCFRDNDFLPKSVKTAKAAVNVLDPSRLELLIDLLCAFDIVNLIGFNNLTKDQQTLLKGKEIGEAIDRMRIEYLVAFYYLP